MSHPPIQTALCSFGMSGKIFHAPFIHAHPGFNLYGIFERSKKTAAEIYPNIKSFDTLEEMLADENIELVVINTPNATHYDYAKKALLAGKHIIVEKPFVTTVAEGEELIELAAKQQKKISVYHNRRWDSDSQVIKKVVDEKLLGDIVEVELHYDRFKEELNPKKHKEIPGPGTGILFDLGSHLIDQVLQLFGSPEAIFADIAIQRPLSQVDDYFEVLMYYPKMRVRLKAGYLVREPLPSYVLHGVQGSFVKMRADVQEADLQAGKTPNTDTWGTEPEEGKGLLHTKHNDQIIKEYIPSFKGNYMGYFDGVYNALRTNTPMPVTAEEGLEVIKIIQTAFKSSDEGCVLNYKG